MTNWFRKRNSRSEGVDRGYTSIGDSDMERGFTTPEDAMLDRIQRGEHNTSETFDDLQWRLVRIAVVTLVILVVVLVAVVVVFM